MSIVSVIEVAKNEGGAVDGFSNQYRRSFMVVTDSTTDNTATVQKAQDPNGPLRIPLMGWFYATPGADRADWDLFARVSLITPRRRPGERFIWDVDVDYSTRAPGQNHLDSVDPIERNPSMSTGHITTTEEMVTDVNGLAVLNSAARPYDPMPMWQIHTPTMTVTWHTGHYHLGTANDYIGAVNSDLFSIAIDRRAGHVYDIPAGVAKLASLTSEQVKEAGVFIIRAQAQFHFRRALSFKGAAPGDQWNTRPIDAGFGACKEIPPPKGESGPSSIEFITFEDSKGRQRQEPTLLDGHGKELYQIACHPERPVPVILNDGHGFQRNPRLDFRTLHAGVGLP